jgi:hypothetical protein
VAKLTVLLPNLPLLAPALTPEGTFQASLTGASGSRYVIEASINLTDWTPLETNTSPFTFSDTNSGNLPSRFYRAHLLP